MKRSNQKSHNQMRDADGRYESSSNASKQDKQDKRSGGRSMQNSERPRDAEGRFTSESKSKK